MKILKTSLLLITAFILTTAFAPAKKKFVFDSNEGKLTVTFPAEYTTDRDEGENVTTIKSTCTLDGITFFASYSLHQVEITDHKDMAEVSYDSFIKSVGAELLSKTDWMVNNNPGIKAVMTLPDENVKLDYRVILVGNIQYQLVVMAAQSDYDEKTASAFFKSFKLK